MDYSIVSRYSSGIKVYHVKDAQGVTIRRFQSKQLCEGYIAQLERINTSVSNEFIKFEFEGYEFTVISDHRGVRIGSMPALKKLTPEELRKYALAVNQLNAEVFELVQLDLEEDEE